MENNKLKDRIRGSLIGGAIGDALGYPVEFIYSYSELQKMYGENGITRFDKTQWWTEDTKNNGIAIISDDTQMTLFTACGILNSVKNKSLVMPSICEAYIEWLLTQIEMKKEGLNQCWISELPEMNSRRAPGGTCISALNNILMGREPQNDSKGCGGVMRISPIPLYGAVDNRMDITEVCRLAAEASKLTHKHPLGYISSAFLSYIIYRLMQDRHPNRDSIKTFIYEGLKKVEEMYPEHLENVNLFVRLIEDAVTYSESPTNDVLIIEDKLGGGWVAEETVAIAVYCSLAHFNDFEKAMVAAVNHSGDSDSTGAVTGNLLGVVFGYEALPDFYKEDLELHDVILHIADDLYNGKKTEYKR